MGSAGAKTGAAGRARARGRIARRLLERLSEGSTELRAAAVFDAGGAQLAASDGRDWTDAAAALWEAADSYREGGFQLHVGGAAGEVFAVRDRQSAVVATGDRFALASLMLSDLRALLRELERETGG